MVLLLIHNIIELILDDISFVLFLFLPSFILISFFLSFSLAITFNFALVVFKLKTKLKSEVVVIAVLFYVLNPIKQKVDPLMNGFSWDNMNTIDLAYVKLLGKQMPVRSFCSK